MGYTPPDAKWYLADMVESITVGRRKKVTVHINTRLIRADSPQEAFARAMELGRKGNLQYRNIDGEKVTIRFLGLRELGVIHDELEHGAELTYRELTVMSLSRLQRLVTPKSKLGVFAPIEASSGPNYVSADIQRALEKKLGHEVRPRRRKAPAPRPKRRQ